jgi:hypothetical protein
MELKSVLAWESALQTTMFNLSLDAYTQACRSARR